VVHHARGLRALTGDDQLTEQISSDFEQADLLDAERAMLRYAHKLTRTPEAMEPGDVALLRDAGWSDAAILDICQITGYFNFVNRLADGLGVPLEKD
jgi:uncharacterized peroxidase-related enzyme